MSAWFKKSAHDRLASREASGGFDTLEKLQAFFQRCDQRERGHEPEWDEHLEVIDQSRRRGLPE